MIEIYVAGSKSNRVQNYAGIGIVVMQDGNIIHTISENLGKGGTINEADYAALFLGIKYVIEEEIKVDKFYISKELVVNQLNGSFRINERKFQKVGSYKLFWMWERGGECKIFTMYTM